VADWTDIPDANLEVGKPTRSIDGLALRDNVPALAEGAAGAPKIQEAALDAAIVSQTKLKTTTATGSVVLPAATGNTLSLTGGLYSWYSWSADNNGSRGLEIGAGDTASGVIGLFNSGGSANSFYVDERYIQASPPYRYGPLFITLMLDAAGNIIGLQVAPDPVWAYHGPTDITPQYKRAGKLYRRRKLLNGQPLKQALTNPAVRRAFVEGALTLTDSEIEITLDYKDSDMAVMPHGFGMVPPGATVLLVRPGTPMMEKLYELLVEDHARTVRDLFLNDFLRVDNTSAIALPGAPDVLKCYNARWKLTP
jgi:hypothetical protein